MRRRLYILAALGCLTMLPGVSCDCGKSTKKQLIGNVKINPIVHLKPGEQIGGQNNQGCRLSVVQMSTYLINLDAFCRENWSFSISYPGQDTQNPAQSVVVPVVYADEVFQEWEGEVNIRNMPHDVFGFRVKASVPLGIWQGGHVNLYFTGNVLQDMGDPDDTNAHTRDPADATKQTTYGFLVPPHIYLNDRGWEDGPSEVLPDYYVLEHEFAHFLLRQMQVQQVGGGAPPTSGRYNEYEHAPEEADQLIEVGAPHPPEVVDIDSKEIKARVEQELMYSP